MSNNITFKNYTKVLSHDAFLTAKKWYVLLYFSWLMIFRIVPLVTYTKTIFPNVELVVSSTFAAFGIILIAWDFFTNRDLFRPQFSTILTIFLGICVISSILNYRYGITDNIKTIIWTSINFYLCFSVPLYRNRDDVIKEVKLFANVFLIFNFIPIFISFIQFILEIGYEVPYERYARPQGFIGGRLFGIFSDPNYTAIIAIFATILSIILMQSYRNRAIKFLYIINIVAQYLYFILSNSRTALFVLIISMPIGIWFVLRKKVHLNNRIIKELVCICIGLCCSFIVFLSYLPTQKAIAYLPVLTSTINHNINSMEDETIDFTRTEYSNDVSNGRINIWRSGWEIFTENPIFGVSPRNIPNYCLEHHPESIIVKSQKKYFQVHSFYLALLTSTGLVGFIAFITFLILAAKKALSYILSNKTNKRNYFIVVACLLCSLLFLLSGVLQLEIVFTNIISTALFWISMGYGIYFINEDSDKELSEPYIKRLFDKIFSKPKKEK